MLMAKRAASAAFAGLDGGVGTGLSRGGRRLMPKREHVTCSEPTVTPNQFGDFLTALAALDQILDLLDALGRELDLAATPDLNGSNP